MLSHRAKGCTSRKIIGIPDIISIFSILLRSRKVKAFPKTFTQGLRRISKILQAGPAAHENDVVANKINILNLSHICILCVKKYYLK